MPSRPPTLLDVPGIAGPNMIGTIAFRNAMQIGYGMNVLVAGGGSVSFLLGAQWASVWATIVVVASGFAVIGCYFSARYNDVRLEKYSSIAVLATYVGQMVAVVLCVIFALGPNGFLPFWWPAALAGQHIWRIRNIARTERAREAAALR